MAWTLAQQKAIETKNKTLLISAAAGSGKTTVLIERIIRSITDSTNPSDISRMLIVTFTRAAASELRTRISVALSKALSENPTDKHLFKQLASLGSAHISTIDSFYGDVVRKNAQKLGISSSLRIADESELAPMRKRIMDDVIELGYEGKLDGTLIPNNNENESCYNAFAFLADSLSDMRNDSDLYKVFTDLYEKLSSHPQSIEFLKISSEMYDTAIDSDFFSTTLGKIIKDHVLCQMKYLEKIAVEICNGFSSPKEVCTAYLPSSENDLAFCRDIIKSLQNDNFATVREKFLNFEPLGQKPLKAEFQTTEIKYFKDLRNDVLKKKIKYIKDHYFASGCSEDELKKYAIRSSQNCNVLYSVLSKFHQLYSEEKLNKNICEFNDIKIWAYNLLVREDGSKTDIAKSISEEFDSIYIDEYQDVDLVQDLIFSAISNKNTRFMVGDVKQSIYAFRGAEPSLFMNYRKNFAQIDPSTSILPDEDNCTIFMSNNFRCDENIIKFANTVCSYIFSLGSKSIEYTKQDDLCFSKEVNNNVNHKIKIVLIDKCKKDKSQSTETTEENSDECFENPEAAYVAKEINDLISSSKKSDGSSILPKDIAVLGRSESICKKIAKELDKYHIKHTGNSGENIFDNSYVSIAFSLIATIDNPQRDVYLSAVILSPLFDFSADELINIRQQFKNCSIYDAIEKYANTKEIDEFDTDLQKKCAEFISSLSELRELSCTLPTDKIVQHIFSRFSLLSKSPDQDTEKALIKFYENARTYEGDEFKGLYSYVKYVEDMIENDKAPTIDEIESDDSVKLMTIHKSKGLEFPICFVSGCASKFNLKDSKRFLLYSSKLGIAMDLSDESSFGKIKTPFKRALARNIDNESIEEEMRVLYVAITRAKEQLYITATPRYGSEKAIENAKLQHSFPCKASVLDSESYISWILSAMYDKLDSDFAKLITISESDISFSCDNSLVEETIVTNDNTNVECADNSYDDIYKQVKETFDYVYPFKHISNLPAKLSVSKLSPSILDINESIPIDDGESSLDIKLPELEQIPEFMIGEKHRAPSAAEKGTATHTFLQFCDFENIKNHGIQSEINRLCKEKYISDSIAEMINIDQIEGFLNSNFFKELQNAKKIWREKRFNILLPAREFTSDPQYKSEIQNENLHVQGVMDIFFIDKDGKLILCDYKTDYLTKWEIEHPEFASEKLRNAHTRQLSYYSLALETIFGKKPDKIYIYSLPLGDTVEVFPTNCTQ